MKDNKKKSSPILGFVGVIAAFFAGTFALGAYVNRKIFNRMKEHNGENNMMNSVVFNNGEINVGEDTDNVYVSAIFGNMNVHIPPMKKEMLCIDIFNLFGNIVIFVPNGVNVVYSAVTNRGNLIPELDECEEEMAPTVYIVGKNSYANVILRRNETEEEQA